MFNPTGVFLWATGAVLFLGAIIETQTPWVDYLGGVGLGLMGIVMLISVFGK